MADLSGHPLERRATMLAERLGQRVDMMANMMRPDNRPIFHTRKSESQALTFWRKHRYDDMGQAVMSTWSPDQVLDLDRRLTIAGTDTPAGGLDGTPLA